MDDGNYDGADHLTDTTARTASIGNNDSYYNLSPVEITVLSVLYGLTILTSLFGNTLVIWIIVRKGRIRQSNTNYFIINLAMVDLFIMIFNLPWTFIYSVNGNVWPWGSVWCKSVWAIGTVALSANAFTFAAIMIDRYQAIVDPLHKYVERRRRVVIALILIWAIAFVTGLPSAVGYDSMFQNESRYDNTTIVQRLVCTFKWAPEHEFIHVVLLAIVQYVGPLTITLVAYRFIRLKLCDSTAIGESSTAEAISIRLKRKVVSMMMVVVVTFSLCVLPSNIFSMLFYSPNKILPQLHQAENSRIIIRVFLLVYWLAMSNSMWNPFIYAYWNSTFRLGFKYVFRWLPFVHWDDGVDGPKFFDQRRTFSTAYRPGSMQQNHHKLHDTTSNNNKNINNHGVADTPKISKASTTITTSDHQSNAPLIDIMDVMDVSTASDNKPSSGPPLLENGC